MSPSRDDGVHIHALSTLPETGDIMMVMAAAIRPTRSGSVIGYVITLVGAVLFVATCFMPYYGFQLGRGGSVSLYDQLKVGPERVEIGAILFLFGGAATILVVAVVGLARGTRTGGAVRFLLAGAVATWSLTWMGSLLQTSNLRDRVIGDLSLETGFWLQAVSIGVTVIGTIVVWFSSRSEVKASNDRYVNEQRVDADT